eukprot:SAG22_NODE_2939_length_2089_cov_1.138693_4_plen_137_part_01
MHCTAHCTAHLLGKHNNWGLTTSTGKNIFSPGSTEAQQRNFIAFVSCLAYATNVHADVIRAGVATASNDHRLGAQEAPPAIISLYTGHTMYEKITEIMAGGPLEGYGEKKGKLGIPDKKALEQHRIEEERLDREIEA